MNAPAIRILLVEDNPGDAGLLRAAIADVGIETFQFQLKHVDRLGAAVAALQCDTFDVVLLDLSLPDSLGLATVTGMHQANPAIPIVVMSGLSDERVAIEAMRIGAQDYLVKGQIDSAMVVRSINHAIERKRIETDLRQQRERIATLHEINLAITASLDLHAVIDSLLERIHRLLPGYALVVRLLNESNGQYEPFAAWNIDITDWANSISSVGGGLTQDIIEKRIPVVVQDATADPRTQHREFFARHRFVTFIGCPLIVSDCTIGILSFFSKERREIGDSEVAFLNMLAGQAAVAIQNCRLYQQIRETNDALGKAVEIKSALIGVMAHELKNPIQVILGNANLVLDGVFGPVPADQAARLRSIEASANELTRLIEGAIDMARLDGGKLTLNISEIDLVSLFDELASEFAGAYELKGIGLEITAPPADLALRTDALKLKEILRNLIENARKYTAKGTVRVHAERCGGGVALVVADTGRGIGTEHLPRVFELFYQENAAGGGRASAGLGLNIVKRLVGALGGEIDVASEVGKGSVFRVTLPFDAESNPIQLTIPLTTP